VTADDLSYLVGLYDREIRWVDRNLDHLLGRIRGAPFARPWLTIVVADHGEEFLEHGSASHGYTLFEEQLRVALVVHPPGRVPAGRVSGQVRLVDVLPTVLDLVGIDALPLGVQGRSLAADLGNHQASAVDAFSEAPLIGDLRAVRTAAGLKLIEDRR